MIERLNQGVIIIKENIDGEDIIVSFDSISCMFIGTNYKALNGVVFNGVQHFLAMGVVVLPLKKDDYNELFDLYKDYLNRETIKLEVAP